MKPTIPSEFIGKTRHIAFALFGKIPQVKADPKLEPLDRCWLLTGPPGVGKTTLAEAIGTLASNSMDVEQINGQSCSIERVRKWQEQGWYRPMGDIRVQIVDEIEATSGAGLMELRSYLDKLPSRTVFVATTNMKVKELPDPLQSRFKVYSFDKVDAHTIAQWLVGQFPITEDQASRFATSAKGNVREAKANTLACIEAISAIHENS